MSRWSRVGSWKTRRYPGSDTDDDTDDGTSPKSDQIGGAKENPHPAEDRMGAEFEIGGPEGARTPDLHTASVALSQLSYRPMIWVGWGLRGQ